MWGAIRRSRGPLGTNHRAWQAGETGFATEGAESLDDIRDRVMPVWTRLADRFEGATYVVVAHGAVIKVVLRDLDIRFFSWDAFRYPNLGITEAVKAQAGWSVVRLACTGEQRTERTTLKPLDTRS